MPHVAQRRAVFSAAPLGRSCQKVFAGRKKIATAEMTRAPVVLSLTLHRLRPPCTPHHRSHANAAISAKSSNPTFPLRDDPATQVTQNCYGTLKLLCNSALSAALSLRCSQRYDADTASMFTLLQIKAAARTHWFHSSLCFLHFLSTRSRLAQLIPMTQ